MIKNPEHGEFPGNLSLVDQGRFALGYYHQRAANLNRNKANPERELPPHEAEEQETEE